jgi:hypothetical protein
VTCRDVLQGNNNNNPLSLHDMIQIHMHRVRRGCGWGGACRHGRDGDGDGGAADACRDAGARDEVTVVPGDPGAGHAGGDGVAHQRPDGGARREGRDEHTQRD